VGGVFLSGFWRRRSTSSLVEMLSRLGLGVRVWDVGNGDEGKSNNNPLGSIVQLTMKYFIPKCCCASDQEKQGTGGGNTSGIIAFP